MAYSERNRRTVAVAALAVAIAACIEAVSPLGSGMALAQQAQGGRNPGNMPAAISATPGGAGATGAVPFSAGSGPVPTQDIAPGAPFGAGDSAAPNPLGIYVAPDENAGSYSSLQPPKLRTSRGGPSPETSCEDLTQSFGDMGQRITGINGSRLERAGVFIHPDVDQAREVQMLKVLLASFQEELQKEAPDLNLAGTYLGAAAETPITEEMVLELSESLCVPVQWNEAAFIARAAEFRRLQHLERVR